MTDLRDGYRLERSARSYLHRWEEDIVRSSLLQLSAHRFKNHLTEPALEKQRFSGLGEVDRLGGQVAREVQRSNPLACLLLGIFPTQTRVLIAAPSR